jgi:hypothetical protein
MFLETLNFKCIDNEMPFNPIKSFSKIKFKEESFMIPGFKVETMNNFLSNNNVRGNISPLNKSNL